MTPVIYGLGNVHNNFVFFLRRGFSFFEYVTDGRTDGRARPVLRPVRTTVQNIFLATAQLWMVD